MSRIAVAVALALATFAGREAFGEEPLLHEVEVVQWSEDNGLRHVSDFLLNYDPYARNYTDVTKEGRSEPLYFLRFEAAEPFTFVMPHSMLIRHQSPTFLAEGVTVYLYDEDGEEATRPEVYAVPNKLLRIRAALLAADAYFRAEAARLGLPYALYDEGESIDVYIGFFGPAEINTGAYATYTGQYIRFRDDLPARKLESTASHEYFHFAQKAVCNEDNSVYRDYQSASLAIRGGFYRTFIDDVTAQWASDAPIRIRRITSTGFDTPDTPDNWLRGYSLEYLANPGRSLFLQSRYAAGILAKYLSEQLDGGKDDGSPQHVYELHRRIYAKGRCGKDEVLGAMAEMLPAQRYQGRTAPDRFARFWRDFGCANLVQVASPRNQPADRLGYHDSAFADRTTMMPVRGLVRRTEESSGPAERIHIEPAADDAERRQRLAELPAQTVEVAPLAHGIALLDLSGANLSTSHRDVAPRPVYLHVTCPGAQREVFLLEQRTAGAGPEDRTASTFRRLEDFSLWDAGRGAFVETAFDRVPDVHFDEGNTYLWIGLSNAAAEDPPAAFDVRYLASPRLMPHPHRRLPGSTTVKLRGGHPMADSRRGLWLNGDEFEIVVMTTGKVHLGADQRQDVPDTERTIQLELVTIDGSVPIRLEGPDGGAVRVDTTPSASGWRYMFRGKIHPHNRHLGLVAARVHLTSLLNLGGDDQARDDSFVFTLQQGRPEVASVRVRAGRDVVYDSDTATQRAVPRATHGGFEMTFAVEFTEPMDPGFTFLTATSPQGEEVAATGLTWSDDNKTVTGFLTLPQSFSPDVGRVQPLAIDGRSAEGARIDTDAVAPGAQADASHFVLLALDEFLEVTLSASASAQRAGRAGEMTWEARWPPTLLAFRLVPNRRKLGVPSHLRHFPVPDDAAGLAREYASTISHAEVRLGIAERNHEQAMAGAGDDWEGGPHDTLVRTAKARLAEAREELAELRAVDEQTATLVRVLGGTAQYTYEESVGGPYDLRFGGGFWRHTDYFRNTTPRSETVKDTRLTMRADPWRVAQPSDQRFEMLPKPTARILTWSIDRQDIEVLNRCLVEQPKLRGNYDVVFYGALCRACTAMWQVSTPWHLLSPAQQMSGSELRRVLRPGHAPPTFFPSIPGRRIARMELNTSFLSKVPVDQGQGERHSRVWIDGVLAQDERVPLEFVGHLDYLPRGAPPGVGRGGLIDWRWDRIEDPVWFLAERGLHTRFIWATASESFESFRVYDVFGSGPLRGSMKVLAQDRDWKRRYELAWTVTRGAGSLGAVTRPVEETVRPPTDDGDADERPGAIMGFVHSRAGVGHLPVVVFLEGPGLPRPAAQEEAIDLEGPTDPRYRVVPVGTTLAITNNSTERRRVEARSSSLRFTKHMAPGETIRPTMSRPGLARFTDQGEPADRVKIRVLPTAFHAVTARMGPFAIRDVPPGTYAIRALPEDARFAPILREITILPGETSRMDFVIERR